VQPLHGEHGQRVTGVEGEGDAMALAERHLPAAQAASVRSRSPCAYRGGRLPSQSAN
jgi:hypothetical protein